jgi:hypothetical protein
MVQREQVKVVSDRLCALKAKDEPDAMRLH